MSNSVLEELRVRHPGGNQLQSSLEVGAAVFQWTHSVKQDAIAKSQVCI